MPLNPEMHVDIDAQLDHIVETENLSYDDAWRKITAEYGVEKPIYDPSDVSTATRITEVVEHVPHANTDPIYGPFGKTASDMLGYIAAVPYRSHISRRGSEIAQLQSKGYISAHESQAIFAAIRHRKAELTSRDTEPPEDY